MLRPARASTVLDRLQAARNSANDLPVHFSFTVPNLSRERLATAVFPDSVGEIRVRETHLSFVVLTGKLAYKIKKSLKLDFIDTSSLERRRELCDEELRLNLRFAPELYLRVVPITIDADTLRFDGTGKAIEYAVEMRQFDSGEELPALLEDRAIDDADIAALADRIADFHRDAAVLERSNSAGTRAYLGHVRNNLTGLAARIGAIHGQAELARLEDWTERHASQEAASLSARESAGFVRECHGDLHSGNIVRWRGALVPFDCIEFDASLRFIDVLNDIAFLTMDLIVRNRRDLAFALLSRYLERTGDYAGMPILPSYLVYRALVRTKVELIAFEQSGETACAERARSYFRTALSVAYPETRPALIIMHGASGSGKSWLSAQLVSQLQAVRIRSDLERKRIAQIDPFDRSQAPNAQIYSLEFNERTYAHLLECARACLRGGLHTIVDAAFLKASERREFAALARAQRAPFVIISCHADEGTLAARIASRRNAQNDPSDADERVMRRQLETMQPFAEEERPHLIEIDTGTDDALARVLERVRKIEAEHRARSSGA